MKIQFQGQNTFSVQGSNTSFVFDPQESFNAEVDFVTDSGTYSEGAQKVKSQKILNLPGEFEISGVAIRSFYSGTKNVVFKTVVDNISIVHFGTLTEDPKAELLKGLGENVDVVLVNVNENYTPKQAKQLIEKLDPRLALIGGDQAFFPKMIDMGAKLEAEKSITISQNMLNEEKTDVLVLSS